MFEIAHQYFSTWNNHDLSGLRKLFSYDIELKDWDIHEIGLENVLKANQKIFESAPLIKAEIISVVANSTKVMAEIKIYINQNETIDVVDILEIDSSLIKNIKAYKC